MEQPQGDSQADVLKQLEGYFLTERDAPEEAQQDAPAGQQVVENEQPDQAEEVQAEEATPEDSGLVELELEDGEVYRVPQKLKDGYLRQSDYTRKTQDVAALTKQAQAVLQQQAVMAAFQEQTKDDQQKLAQVQAELSRFKQLDWTNLDTETYIKTRGYIDQLKEQASDLEKTLGMKAQKVQEQIRQYRSEASRNAYEFIGRHIKEWTPNSDAEKQAAEYANRYGIAPENLAEVALIYPGFAVMAHKAAQFDKLQSTKGQAVQKARSAPPVVKPGASNPQTSVAANKVRDIQGRFTKSGSKEDFAALLLAKGMVK